MTTANPVIIYLRWEGDPETGTCKAVTTNYQPPGGGVQRQHTFSTIGAGTPDGWKPNSRVDYDYPHFGEIRDYMAFRKDRAEQSGGSMPVTINFADGVPVQMVVNMLDICQELKITDFAINAEGID